MSFESIHTMVAIERRRALVEEAAAYSRAAQARRHRGDAAGPGRREDLARRIRRIRDLATVQIRPIRPSDDVLLREGFLRLGQRSREQRFLGPKGSLTQAELRYFTDVDHFDHEALVAVSRIDGRGLGVARYIRLRDDRESADVAVTVVDEWQLRGLGTALVTRLAALARCAGIRTFVALTSADNAGAHGLLHKVSDEVTLVGRDIGTMTYELALPPMPSELRRVRRLMLGPVVSDCAGAG
jgi:GNAT superfamily N-acetyltransferase